MRKTIVTGVSALVVCSLAIPMTANAATPSQYDNSKISVSYADLNIDNEAGARALYTRLQQAAEKVCNVESYRELGSLARVAQAEQCYTATLGEAVSKVDSDALKKIHTS